MSENVARKSDDLYGSFLLGAAEFALPVARVQEVVRGAPSYSAVPLAPDFLLGLYHLRGTVIPVIDMRRILQLPPPEGEVESRIAVIEMNEELIGLLFDGTGEIFPGGGEIRSDFGDGHGGVVSGVFKRDQGRRIVQILDVHRLFQLEKTPRDANGRASRARRVSDRGRRRQAITFDVGPARCALAISDIQEIIKVPEIHSENLATATSLGHVEVRGATIPVVDFAALLGYRKAGADGDLTESSRIMVMRIEDLRIGLLVDAVDSIVSFFADEVLDFPKIGQGRADMIAGCVVDAKNGDFLLLHKDRVLADDEVLKITHGHSQLYRESAARTEARKTSQGTRRAYLTFKVDGDYAIGMNEVREIIELPSNLLTPPGLPEHVLGVLNLRGQMLTVVDARRMYRRPPVEGVRPKVLVFQRGGQDFGLVVDGVDSIVTAAESEKVRIPEILYRRDHASLNDDIQEAVEVKDPQGVTRSLLILDADAIQKRLQGVRTA